MSNLRAHRDELAAAAGLARVAELRNVTLVQASLESSLAECSRSATYDVVNDVNPVDGGFSVVDERIMVVRAGVEVLCRLVERADEPEGAREGTVRLRVRIVYAMEYDLPAPPVPDSVRTVAMPAFARLNAVHNCWPYLRQEVHRLTAAAGLAVLLPLLRITTEPPSGAPESAAEVNAATEPEPSPARTVGRTPRRSRKVGSRSED